FQLAHKQAVLLELLEHQGGIAPLAVTPPIRGPQWGYRRKARLGVKHVPKKGGVIVGFRERASPYITDCHGCDVLDERIARQLPSLRALIDGLSIRDRVPQLEVAAGDAATVIVVRHLAAPSDADRAALADFAASSGIHVYLQSGGLDTVTPLTPPAAVLEYGVGDVTLGFEPVDFTQVNAGINTQMVARALDCLAPGPSDRVADLFCGIGNFTLPLARRAASVIGVEGDAALVARARGNAERNGIDNCDYAVCDLADADAVARLELGRPTQLLLDPPRAGAAAVIEGIDFSTIGRIVYVSCNPVTFARDAGLLVNRHGYRLAETGILDMFPHTAHVESLSLFTRA
ncbi:MAG: methyltransferase domain-containing protein, partial [Gammaproteobacteria bacterium]